MLSTSPDRNAVVPKTSVRMVSTRSVAEPSFTSMRWFSVRSKRPRADQQDHGKGDLADHEHCPRAVLTPARSAPLSFHGGLKIDARGLPGGARPKISAVRSERR